MISYFNTYFNSYFAGYFGQYTNPFPAMALGTKRVLKKKHELKRELREIKKKVNQKPEIYIDYQQKINEIEAEIIRLDGFLVEYRATVASRRKLEDEFLILMSY